MQWIAQLNQSLVEPRAAYFVQGALAGYVEEYEGLTFVTVHGAGHMVPQFKRPEAYHAIFNWVKNVPL